ncbi:MAG TPA: ABC transporter permease [Aggregatilinea sp.]|uniref:ABC transporter permease n=1 Tax=Aggregatilinea sp. TaxID=2806333 RepID=UPI002C95FFF8|nr:ABC transporter permease [Aggregatilinea sp.]HML24210.1 ABC transporter permease [Aggregatilinea sp.]
MTRFILRRLVFFVLTLFITSVLVFALTRILPGDVARVLLGREASPEAVQAKREELGLDKPLAVQYVNWAGDFITGDWGTTYSTPREDIRDLVIQRASNSARLAALTLLIAVPLSITLGVIAGLSEGRFADGAISILTLSVVSLPEFVTGLFLINTVALGWGDNPIADRLGWFPASSAIRADASFSEALPAMWLPAVAATLVLLAYIVRLVRAGVIEELKKGYVRTAVLKGLPYRVVVVKHVLRNALIPTVTVIATSTGWLISGMVVIESVFSYPGLGRLLINNAIDNRDLPLIQAIVMLTVAVILIANFTADLLYALLNPRIRLE